MDFTIISLIGLLLLCGVEILIGVLKRSRILVAIGIIFGAVLILALILTLEYSSSVYLPGPGKIL